MTRAAIIRIAAVAMNSQRWLRASAFRAEREPGLTAAGQTRRVWWCSGLFVCISVLVQVCSAVTVKAQWNEAPPEDSKPQVRPAYSPDGNPGWLGNSTDGSVIYYPLSLREAIAQSLTESGFVRVLNGDVRVSVSAVYETFINSQQIDAATGRFLPSLTARVEGSQINQPPDAFFGPGIAANNRRDILDTSLRVSQPLKTGGTASIGLEPPLAYLYFPDGGNPNGFNPVYSNDLVLRVQQPILRGGGRATAEAPIRIAGSQLTQSRWELEEELNSQIRSVSQAYWSLYQAYTELRATRAVIPLAEESVRIEKLRYDAERTIYSDLARSLVQLNIFRSAESRVSAQVRQRVLQLRQLMGLPPHMRLMFLPSDIPRRSAEIVDISEYAETAVVQNPTVNARRERLKQRVIDLQVASNRVYPAVNTTAEYRTSGITDRYDSSMRQAFQGTYDTWTLGVGVDIPIGNRTARSNRNIAELERVREQMRITAAEEQVRYQVADVVTRLNAQHDQIRFSEDRVRQAQDWLRIAGIRYAQPPARATGRDLMLLELADYQLAMQEYVDSVTAVGISVSRYNSTLAELDEIQGTVLKKWNLQLEDSHSQNTGSGPEIAADSFPAKSDVGTHPPGPYPGGAPDWVSGSRYPRTFQGGHSGPSLYPGGRSELAGPDAGADRSDGQTADPKLQGAFPDR